MYSISDNMGPQRITILCDCGRNFIAEELYFCYSCLKHYCRFCTQQTIQSYSCRSCPQIQQTSEINLIVQCSVCLECPFCSNILQFVSDSSKKVSLYCQFCSWGSVSSTFVGNSNDDVYKLHQAFLKEKFEAYILSINKIAQKLKDKLTEQNKKKKFYELLQKQQNQQIKQLEAPKKWTLQDLKSKLQAQVEEQKLDEETLDLEGKINLKLQPSENDTKIYAQFNLKKVGQIYRGAYFDSKNQEPASLESELQAFEADAQLKTDCQQRFKFPLHQPEFKADTFPTFPFLQSSKNKKCKTCSQHLIKISHSQKLKSEYQHIQCFSQYIPKFQIQRPLIRKHSETQLLV